MYFFWIHKAVKKFLAVWSNATSFAFRRHQHLFCCRAVSRYGKWPSRSSLNYVFHVLGPMQSSAIFWVMNDDSLKHILYLITMLLQ